MITNDQRYAHRTHTHTLGQPANFSRIAVWLCVCLRVCVLYNCDKNEPEYPLLNDDFLKRRWLLFAVALLLSGCPHHIHFYLLNAFHHISFLFTSFHSFSVIRMAKLSSVPTLCRVFAQSCCCCIYFNSKIKVSASGLLCSIALYGQSQFQATNAMVIFI